MNVATISMPREEARAKLAQYKAALESGADSGVIEGEYEAAVAAYAALAQGTPLLDLSEAFRMAPVDERGRVRLAIARADQPQVFMTHPTGSTRASFRAITRTRYAIRDQEVTVDTGRLNPSGSRWLSGYALVPVVPANLRVERGSGAWRSRGRRRDLSRLFVLWEVEQWSDAQITTRPDRDPFLLQRIAGDLYAIVGHWDLTDVERAIMAGRARV